MDNNHELAVQIVQELRTVTKSLYAATNAIQTFLGITNEQVVAPDAPKPQAETPPKPEPLKLEKVRGVLADKSRAGFTAEIRTLLEKHGGSKLSDISPDRYHELLKDAEGLK